MLHLRMQLQPQHPAVVKESAVAHHQRQDQRRRCKTCRGHRCASGVSEGTSRPRSQGPARRRGDGRRGGRAGAGQRQGRKERPAGQDCAAGPWSSPVVRRVPGPAPVGGSLRRQGWPRRADAPRPIGGASGLPVPSTEFCTPAAGPAPQAPPAARWASPEGAGPRRGAARARPTGRTWRTGSHAGRRRTARSLVTASSRPPGAAGRRLPAKRDLPHGKRPLLRSPSRRHESHERGPSLSRNRAGAEFRPFARRRRRGTGSKRQAKGVCRRWPQTTYLQRDEPNGGARGPD